MLLAYDDHGPGPVVVLLHGFPLNRKIWSLQEGRVGSMYRMIAPDLRGHGETAAPPGIYSMEAMAEDVIELLEALQISEPIVLGGLSMGGYVALALIAKYPERVRGLMLIDTRASADTPEVARNREDLARKTEASGKVGHVVEGMFPRMFSDATRVGHPERLTCGPRGDGEDLRPRRGRGTPGHGLPTRSHGRPGADQRADARHGRRRGRDHATG